MHEQVSGDWDSPPGWRMNVAPTPYRYATGRERLQAFSELNLMKQDSVSRIVGIGHRGQGLKFAGTMLFVRKRLARQAQILLKQVEQSMAMNAVAPLA